MPTKMEVLLKYTVSLIFICTLANLVCGCTDFIIGCKDGATVHSRTMEYEVPLPWVIRSQPAGYVEKAMLPQNCQTNRQAEKPLSWKSLYKIMFINSVGNFDICNQTWVDGMNSEGLSAGALYFEQYASYAKQVPQEECGNAISHMQMINFLLANFATVQEIRLAFQKDRFPLVWEQPTRYWVPPRVLNNFVFPFHWSVVDRSGDAIIIEYTKEGRRIFDNEAGIMTNNPTYDWHQTNLKNYVNLQNTGFPARNFTRHDHDYSIRSFGLGSGFLGIPGDFTSPSRFVRTAAMVRFSGDARDAKSGVLKALHILNSVDITQGTSEDYTTFAIAKDLTNNIMYLRAHDYVSIRSIHMDRLPDNSSVWMPVEGSFDDGVKDVTGQMVQ